MLNEKEDEVFIQKLNELEIKEKINFCGSQPLSARGNELDSLIF